MIIKPPTKPPYFSCSNITGEQPTIFLAGSIEMGKAEDWQERVGKILEEKFLVLNPRRNPEDWKEGVDIQNKNDPNFREQVEWELECQELANAILMYLIPGTMSPISLLELGEFHPTVVVCPDGFWRKGNVDLVCERYGIKQAKSLDDAVNYFLNEWEH